MAPTPLPLPDPEAAPPALEYEAAACFAGLHAVQERVALVLTDGRLALRFGAAVLELPASFTIEGAIEPECKLVAISSKEPIVLPGHVRAPPTHFDQRSAVKRKKCLWVVSPHLDARLEHECKKLDSVQWRRSLAQTLIGEHPEIKRLFSSDPSQPLRETRASRSPSRRARSASPAAVGAASSPDAEAPPQQAPVEPAEATLTLADWRARAYAAEAQLAVERTQIAAYQHQLAAEATARAQANARLDTAHELLAARADLHERLQAHLNPNADTLALLEAVLDRLDLLPPTQPDRIFRAMARLAQLGERVAQQPGSHF